MTSVQCEWSVQNFTHAVPLNNAPVAELADDGYEPEVQWNDFAWSHLLMPFVMQIALMPVLKFFRWVFTKNMQTLGLFIYAFIGTEAVPKVKYPQFMVGCYGLQFVFSFAFVIISGERMKPPHDTSDSDAMQMFEFILLVFFLCHYWVIQIRNEFSLTKSWGAAPLIDMFTIVPAFGWSFFPDPEGQTPRWVSWDFLRIYHVLVAFERVSAVLDRHISEFTRAVCIRALRFVALGVMYGGTVLVLEVLGEIPVKSMQDRPITTAMGDISMIQMVYWICTSIAMVGYGDYSPTTALTKSTTAVCILSGVTFFTWVTNSLVRLKGLLGRGEGSYRGKGKGHVVAVGATVGRGGAMVQTFLEEIFHPEHEHEGWPDVVILSEIPFQEELKHFVRTSRALSSKVRHKIILLVGGAQNRDDLKRVQIDACQLAIVLPDVETLFPDAEDEGNIQRALSMKCFGGPSMPLRLLLCCGKSRAVNAGVPGTSCLSATDLKANIIAHSMRVPGFIPLVANLMRSFQTPFIEFGLTKLSQDMKDYFHGVGHEIYGLTLKDQFAGQTFGNLAAAAFEKHAIILLAMLVNGRLLIAPMTNICPAGSVIFCMAQSSDDAKKFSQQGKDWRKILLKQQGEFEEPAIRATSPNHGPDDPMLANVSQARADLMLSGEMIEGPNVEESLSPAPPVHAISVEDAGGLAGHPTKVPPVTEAFEPEQEPGEADKLAGAFGHSSWAIAGTSWSQRSGQDRQQRVQQEEQQQQQQLQPVVQQQQSQQQQALSEREHRVPRQSMLGEIASIPVASHYVEPAHLKAQRYRRHPASVTVILLGKVAWQQLGTFIGLLHDTEVLPFIQPMMVLCDEEPPDWLSKKFYEVAFIVGPPRMDNLLRVGVLDSCSVVVLAGESKPDTSVMEADSAMIMVASIIEHLIVAFERGGMFRMYEFRDGNAVCLLPENLRRPGEKDPYEGGDPSANQVTELKMHSRYLAGEVMTFDFMGTMLGRMYYLPGTVDLVEAYAMPSKGSQDSFSWQTHVPPEFVNKTFLELFKRYSCRSGSSSDGAPALATALYRQSSEKGKECFFVFTSPPKSTVLRKTDYVIWSGPVSFGKEMAKKKTIKTCIIAGQCT